MYLSIYIYIHTHIYMVVDTGGEGRPLEETAGEKLAEYVPSRLR